MVKGWWCGGLGNRGNGLLWDNRGKIGLRFDIYSVPITVLHDSITCQIIAIDIRQRHIPIIFDFRYTDCIPITLIDRRRFISEGNIRRFQHIGHFFIFEIFFEFSIITTKSILMNLLIHLINFFMSYFAYLFPYLF
jgi:hypothetical protein